MATFFEKARSLLGNNAYRYGNAGSSLKLPGVKATTEQGVSGVAIFGGYIRNIERSPKWIGIRKYDTATDILLNVSIVAASLHYFLNLIAHPQWQVVPAGDDDNDSEAKKYAELVEDIIKHTDTPWPRIVRRAALYRFHGFGIQEWIAKKRDDGNIGFRDIEPRPQFTIERWELDQTGAVTGVWQRSPQTGRLLGIPRSKVVYLVDDAISDSPEGLGIFRHLAEPYERLKTYLELEARGYERDLRGTPIGKAPITALNKAVEAGEISEAFAKKMMDEFDAFVTLQKKQSDTGMIIDSMPYQSATAQGPSIAGVPQWDISLMTGAANGIEALGSAIDRLQREMARIMGTEPLDDGRPRRKPCHRQCLPSNIAAAFAKDLIDPLWKLKGWPELDAIAGRLDGMNRQARQDRRCARQRTGPDQKAIRDLIAELKQ